MNEAERRIIVKGHLPWPEKAAHALAQFVACFPPNVHVRVDAIVVDVTALGESEPQCLRGVTEVTTERRIGFVDKPGWDEVYWELDGSALRPMKVKVEEPA